METLLTTVKAAETAGNESSSGFLTAVQTKSIQQKRQTEKNNHVEIPKSTAHTTSRITKPEEVLQVLRSNPETESLIAILKQLVAEDGFPAGFSIHMPGPLQAQIINTLVGTIAPDFWLALTERHQTLLLRSLRNVAGISALVARLKLLSSQAKVGKPEDTARLIEDVLGILSRLLVGSQVVHEVWMTLQRKQVDKIKCGLAWKEFVNVMGSGRIIAAFAEAEDTLRTTSIKMQPHWLARGSDYTDWLGSNVAALLTFVGSHSQDEASNAAAQLLTRALSLGYPDCLIRSLLSPLVRHDVDAKTTDQASIQLLFRSLQAFTKRQLLEHIIRWLSGLVPSGPQTPVSDGRRSNADDAATAALLDMIIRDDPVLQQHLFTLLSNPVLSSTISFPVRLACLSALDLVAADELSTSLEKLLSSFGDRLFISHAPSLQQESIAQTLLIMAGYLHSRSPMAVLMAARSSGHMQGVSSRLEASNQRARWLGMVVGTALSGLVDKDGSKMNFGTDDMKTLEAEWYLGLVKVERASGTLQDFLRLIEAGNKVTTARRIPTQKPTTKELPVIDGKRVFGPPRPPKQIQTEVEGEKITEILDDESDEDDDLKPYAKPDSDPEDSDEDATLVNRNKPRVPVYIRSLMAMLRETENADRFQLAIKHAATLIRRKSGLGREVTDHAEELAQILCNLQDPFGMESFEELRLQALIAVLLSDIRTLAPWMSRQAFTGEYSIAQRCVMLTALGLGGRELAGFMEEDELNPNFATADFPSKRLPPRLHALYSPADPSLKRLEAARNSVEHQLIQPMALKAADKTTAHLNAVKVRTFSSRMDVERTKRKPTANQLATIFGEAFFFPLVGRYQQDIAAYASASIFANTPFLLVTFLKTLALLLHASGPVTLGLPQVTAEFWDLLLGLRVQAVGDISIMEAVLFSLLTLLEVNTDKKRIVDEHPKQLMETQQWVNMVFDRTGGGNLVTEGNGMEAKVRTLTAAVLVKTGEIIEGYQKALLGSYVDF